MYNPIVYQERVRKAREKNICPDCGKPMDREGYSCRSCTDRKSKNSAERRRFLLEIGICPRCGKNKLWGDEKNCPECSANQYECNMRNREREHYNKTHNEWARRTHKEMIEKGICTRCRKKKADGGFKTCGKCRERDKEGKRRRGYKKIKPKDKYGLGLCYFCDRPLKEGFKVCEHHYQLNLEKLKHEKVLEYREEIRKNIHRTIFVKKKG